MKSNNRTIFIFAGILLLVGLGGLYLLWQRILNSLEERYALVAPVVAAEAPYLKVRVMAKQYAWNFHYAGADGKFGVTDPSAITDKNPMGLRFSDPESADDIVTSELVLPCGKRIALAVTSADVIHALGGLDPGLQLDAIPGMENTMSVTTPNTSKSGNVVCAQLCGAGHAQCQAPYRMVPFADFETWISSQLPALAIVKLGISR